MRIQRTGRPTARTLTGCILSLVLLLALVSSAAALAYDKPPDYADYRPQGSCSFIAGKTIIVTLLVNDSGKTQWKQETIDNAQFCALTAADFLMSQAEKNGKKSEILCWNADRPDLCYEIVLDNAAALVRDQYINGYDYQEEIDEKIASVVPIEKLTQKYGTDSIGFIAIHEGVGRSFALPYYYGLGSAGYYESVAIYAYDTEGAEIPATYAHELLHLFGAIDLYEVRDYDRVSLELCLYIWDNEPTEIMLDVYDENSVPNHQSITRTLSDLTLYLVGLIEHPDILNRFPELERKYPAAYDYDDYYSYYSEMEETDDAAAKPPRLP